MPQPLAISNVRVFDGSGSPAVTGASILIQDGRIEALGRGLAAPDGASVIEGAGLTALPGLIDCHVHLTLDGDPDSALAATEPPALQTIRAVVNARRALEAGITAVRDCGSRDGVMVEVAQAIERGIIPGPRIVACGRLLTITGGHAHFLGREVDGVDDMRRAVREEVKRGAGAIKVVATGGVLTPGISYGRTAFTEAELRAAVDEAHNAGLRIASHAIGNTGIKRALAAGVDTIEHGVQLDEAAIGLFQEGGAWLVATLAAVEHIVRNGRAAGIPEYVVAKAEAVREQHLASFRQARASGVRIAGGTDAGTPFNRHGDLATELELMVEQGLTPADALVAATSNAALALGLADVAGRLAPGRPADLLLVAGEPDRRIEDVRQVRLVVKDGRIVADRRDRDWS